MPTYQFLNTNTDEIEEHTMRIAELDEFKDRLAKKYAIDKSSIITYDKMMSMKDNGTPHWNVIVMPGDGDDSANRADVLGTYLLFH